MAMNIFRLIGDLCNISGTVLLFWMLGNEATAEGISKKSQELYLLVYSSRYLDLFTTFYSLYNSAVKVFHIASTLYVIYTISVMDLSETTRSERRYQDSFVLWYYVAPCLLIAAALQAFQKGDDMYGAPRFTWMEMLWSFSICLEAVAMLPQLLLFRRRRTRRKSLCWYIGLKGIYRLLYILNWIYRSYTERAYRHHLLVYVGGVLQVAMYTDFWLHMLGECRRRNSSNGVADHQDANLDETHMSEQSTEPLLTGDSPERDATDTSSPHSSSSSVPSHPEETAIV